MPRLLLLILIIGVLAGTLAFLFQGLPLAVKPASNELPGQVESSAAKSSIADSSVDIRDYGSSNIESSCYSTYSAQMEAFYKETFSEDVLRTIVDNSIDNIDQDSPEELIVFAAHVADSTEDRLDIYRNVINERINTPYLLWSATNACLAAKNRIDCPAEHWAELLVDVDSENSLAWIRAAVAYYQSGDQQAARTALERAGQAYETNDYWIEDIDAAKSAIDQVGGFSEPMAYTSAIGFAAAFVSPLKNYSDMCSEMSTKSADWASACEKFGRSSGHRAKTFMTKTVSLDIERLALKSLGRTKEAISKEQTKDKLLRTMVRDEEILRYPDSTYIWIEALRHKGEIEAIRHMRSLNRQREQSGYQVPCGDIRLN